MTCRKTILTILCLCFFAYSEAQGITREPSLAFQTGMINYHGDIKPNSFTFNHSNLAVSFILRKPLNKYFSLRTGLHFGKLEAADRYNRDYLKPRNLSFFSNIMEVSAGMEMNMLNITSTRFSPYLFWGVSVFHMNPYTYNLKGEKVYLKPLSTEGQGLPQYPEQKPYSLVQVALNFGGGFKYALTNAITLGIEFSQRKSFTDYIDDVSTYYVDPDILMDIKGPEAVELSYRGDELNGGSTDPYPREFAQRGTESEMDWYYFFGVSIHVKINALKQFLSDQVNRHFQINKIPCPRNF